MNRNWSTYRLLVRSTRHSQMEPPKCFICNTEIRLGERYRDGGSIKAHEICVLGERTNERRTNSIASPRTAGNRSPI
jgi:hypothetical protein